MNLKFSFQTKLFMVYSLLITIIIGIAFSSFYWYYKKVNVETLINNYQREADNLAQQLDNSIYTMDRLLMQIKYNPTIASTLYYIPYQSDAEHYFENHPDSANQLKDIISSIVGLDPQFYYRVSLISRSGAFLGVGAYYDGRSASRRISQLDWFERLSENTEYRLLLPPHQDDWDQTENKVVSVIRKIGDSANVQALVEIQIPYTFIEKISSFDRTSIDGGKTLTILSQDGSQVYPLPESEHDTRSTYSNFREDLSEQDWDAGGYTYLNGANDRKELVVYNRADYSDWDVLISQPQHEFLEPTRRAGYLFMSAALLIAALTLFMLYYSTKRLVDPLRKLRDTMNLVNIESIQSAQDHHLFVGADLHNTHNELHHVYRSFRKMLQRLEESKEQAIEAHSRELKSHFAALQAQINPHFLYNTLSLIGMMGNETGNAQIMNLTAMLAGMFRYITYSTGQPVTLREELSHTTNYLSIMQIRYGDHLMLDVDMEGDVLDCKLPKVTLQPFVENCFKHGFNNKRQPWTINIRAYEEKERYIIEIIDDGVGFPEHELDRFRQQLFVNSGDSMMTNNERNQEGSGMMNTYERLHYHFGYELLFEVDNCADGGALVRFGWPVKRNSKGALA